MRRDPIAGPEGVGCQREEPGETAARLSRTREACGGFRSAGAAAAGAASQCPHRPHAPPVRSLAAPQDGETAIFYAMSNEIRVLAELGADLNSRSPKKVASAVAIWETMGGEGGSLRHLHRGGPMTHPPQAARMRIRPGSNAHAPRPPSGPATAHSAHRGADPTSERDDHAPRCSVLQIPGIDEGLCGNDGRVRRRPYRDDRRESPRGAVSGLCGQAPKWRGGARRAQWEVRRERMLHGLSPSPSHPAPSCECRMARPRLTSLKRRAPKRSLSGRSPRVWSAGGGVTPSRPRLRSPTSGTPRQSSALPSAPSCAPAKTRSGASPLRLCRDDASYPSAHHKWSSNTQDQYNVKESGTWRGTRALFPRGPRGAWSMGSPKDSVTTTAAGPSGQHGERQSDKPPRVLTSAAAGLDLVGLVVQPAPRLDARFDPVQRHHLEDSTLR